MIAHLSVEEVLALQLAQQWERQVKGDQIFFTHPNNGGSMVVDLPSQTVMVFNSSRPTEQEIRQGVEFQIKNRQDISLYARLLQAEANALTNNLKRPRNSDNPLRLFPYLMSSAAIVEVFKQNLGPTFALLETPEQLEKFRAIRDELNYAEAERRQLLVNKIQLLTGTYTHSSDLFLLLGINHGGHYIAWQEAWVGEPPDLDDFGDTLELRWVSCDHCGFEARVTYTFGDEGDRIGELFNIWGVHQENHRGSDNLKIGRLGA